MNLREVARKWIRGCHIVTKSQSPVELLVSQECGAVLMWPSDAEDVFRDPCRGLSAAAPLDVHSACDTVGKPPTATRWLLDPREHTFRVHAT